MLSNEDKGVSLEKAFKRPISVKRWEGIAGEGLPFKRHPEAKLEPSRAALGDAQGQPTERYFWSHYGRVMTERRTELGYPYLNALEPTLREIIENEDITRKELYP